MDPNKSKTDFPRPDRETTAQGAPPHERASAAGEKAADDRAHGFSQDSGYAASGGSQAEPTPAEQKTGAEARRGEILPRGPHDERPGTGVPNINTASREEIAKTDFVGASLAEAIVALRDKVGSFNSWEELRQIAGMKANKIAELQRAFRLDPTH
jgi:competence ComEA-like helix-hairpin-helix protein